MSVLDLLKPSPHVKEIDNPEEVKSKYWYWRLRTFYSMYVGYAAFYFSRKSFTFAMPVLIADLGFTKTEVGFLGSILSLTYGASKFVSGVMSDKSNPRYFMGIGLILTGILNIFFGLSSTLTAFAIIWGLNGWFQGWGWPPCAKLLTHWYSQSERGSWWSIWNTSHNVGGAIIPLLVGGIAQSMGWRMAMYVPGAICILIGFFIIERLRDTPRSLGLPSIEKFRNDHTTTKKEEDKEVSTKEILFTYVLKNPYIWLLAFAYFFVYVIRTAINDWSQLYFVETKGYSCLLAGGCIFAFEAGGFVGSIVSGWSSDWLFKGKRGPVNAIFVILTSLALLWFWKMPVGGSIALAYTVMFSLGFAIFGPQMLIGVAAAELSHKKAAGTATGFAGWFAYAGAAAAGAPLGQLMKTYGWEGFFVTIVVCSFIAFAFLMPLWGKKSRTNSN